MKNRELINDTANKRGTYGFNLLNDRQRASVCGEFDFLHCAINEDAKGGRVMLRNGKLLDFELTLIGVRNVQIISA